MDDINNWRVKIGTFGCHRSWRAQHVKFICIEFRNWILWQKILKILREI